MGEPIVIARILKIERWEVGKEVSVVPCEKSPNTSLMTLKVEEGIESQGK